MNFPEDVRYTEDHEWIRLTEGKVAFVGITDHAQNELDELVYIEVDTVGEHLDAGEVFGSVEAVKTTSDLFMPVAGTVVEFNSQLDESEGDDPTLVNRDPYGEGWIIKIEVDNPEDIESLETAEAYKKLVS